MLKFIKKLFTRTICFQTESAYHRIVAVQDVGKTYSTVRICGFLPSQTPCLTPGDRLTIQHKCKQGAPIIYKVLPPSSESDANGMALVSFSPAIKWDDKNKKVTVYRKINLDSQ